MRHRKIGVVVEDRGRRQVLSDGRLMKLLLEAQGRVDGLQTLSRFSIMNTSTDQAFDATMPTLLALARTKVTQLMGELARRIRHRV